MEAARLTHPLWNTGEGRIRAVWRVLVVLAAVIAAQLAVGSSLVDLPRYLAWTGDTFIGQLLVPLLVVAAGARWLDHRPLVGYGLRLNPGWWREFAFGAGLGLAMYGLLFAVLVTTGWARVADVLSPGPQGLLWVPLALITLNWLTNGVWEELVFRGVMVKNAAEGFSGRLSPTGALLAALVVSSVVFAVVHIPLYLDAGHSMVGLFAMWLGMGLLLGWTYLLTGRLGMAMGLHFTVNLAMNNVFGLHGEFGQAPTLLLTEVVGPPTVVAIGGVLHVVVIVLAAAAVLGWARRRPQGLQLAEALTEPPAEVRQRVHHRRESDHGAAQERGGR